MTVSVTVIITSYNSSKFIDKTIMSIVDQSLKPNKIIIIDDNSNDIKILEKVVNDIKRDNFKNIELIICSKNNGPGHNRNLAWSKCNTDYIAFCDDDDYWYIDKLKKQIQIFEFNKNVKLVASKKKIINKSSINKFRKELKFSKLYFYLLIFKNTIPTSSVIIRSELSDRFLNEYYAEDYYLWLSLLKKKYDCYIINEYLCEKIHLNKTNLSDKIIEINKGVQNVLNHFYSKNLLNNLIVTLAKLYYYFKMRIKIYIKTN